MLQAVDDFRHEVVGHMSHNPMAPLRRIGIICPLVTGSAVAPLWPCAIVIERVSQLVGIFVLVRKALKPFSVRTHRLVPIAVHDSQRRVGKTPLFLRLQVSTKVRKGHARPRHIHQRIPENQFGGRPSVACIGEERIHFKGGVGLSRIGFQHMKNFVFAALIIHAQIESATHLRAVTRHRLEVGPATSIATTEPCGMIKHNSRTQRIEVTILLKTLAPADARQHRKGRPHHLVLSGVILERES